MPQITRHLDLPYQAKDMFELVSDIQRYPEFIKWITALRVKSPMQSGAVVTCIGEAIIGFKGFTERFATHVRADFETLTVDVALADGPFKKLENKWSMTAAETGSHLQFDINYEFSNPVLRALAASNTDLAVDKIMSSFLTEAEKRYAGAPTA